MSSVVEPTLASWRRMDMKTALPTLLCVAVVCALSGCQDKGGASAEGCSTSPSIGFEGREYTAVEALDGMTTDEVEVGPRLGFGTVTLTCGDDPGRRVRVFAVVGIPPTQAVFAKPVYGLMAR
jgi:hypothetical protein